MTSTKDKDKKTKIPYEPPRLFDLDGGVAYAAAPCSPGGSPAGGACADGSAATAGHCKTGNVAGGQCQAGGAAAGGKCQFGNVPA
jgi:hypothetical protein